MSKGFVEKAMEAARPEIERVTIGTDVRISLADFAGEFVDLEPWQREVIEAMAAIPPEMRDKLYLVGNPSGRDGPDQATISIALGRHADRIIIDDPWADHFQHETPALNMIVGEEAWEIKHQLPYLKLVEEARIERMHALDNARYPGKLIEPKPLKLGQAARPDPRNRAERRAKDARRRKGRQ